MNNPLYSKIDAIIEGILGTWGQWQVGDELTIADFDSIRNKASVRQRLDILGFLMSLNKTTSYYYRSTSSNNKRRKTHNKEATADLLLQLQQSPITVKESQPIKMRRNMQMSICSLRKQGYQIVTERRTSKTSVNITIYTLKNTANEVA